MTTSQSIGPTSRPPSCTRGWRDSDRDSPPPSPVAGAGRHGVRQRAAVDGHDAVMSFQAVVQSWKPTQSSPLPSTHFLVGVVQ